MIEVNLLNLKKNVETIRKTSKGLIGVVKNDAYGCGIVEVGNYLVEIGVSYLLVNDIDEALNLVNSGVKVPILLFNGLNRDDYHYLNKYPNLVISINSYMNLLDLVTHFNGEFTIQIQIDTALNRSGIKDMTEYDDLLKLIDKENRVRVDGIFTHFANPKMAVSQLEEFKKYVNKREFKMVHCSASSTYDLIDYGNFVRCGLALYNINQVMRVVSKPLVIRDVKKGETIGYNGLYRASEDIKVAVIPIGYGNGYRLKLSGFNVYTNGNYYKVIGQICMNHIFVLIDDYVDMNSVFELTSENLRADSLADYLGTSTYEIYTNFHFDKRVYIK